MRTLVIIPAYNEENSIINVVESLRFLNINQKIDFIVINDSSTDSTKKVLNDNDINHINLIVNLGIGGGVQTGYIYAYENNYDIAVQMDGDGQHDSSYLESLIKPIMQNEADIVIGSRFLENEGFQSSVMRRAGINFLSTLIKVTCGVRIKDVTSGFRAINKQMIKIFAYEYAQDYPEPEAIVIGYMSGAIIKEIPVVMKERIEGTSSISKVKSVYYMFKVTIAILLQRISHRKRR